MKIERYSDIVKDDPKLRPYQQKAKKEIFEAWDEVDNVMFQMPTGTGKTRLFTSIISDINKYSIKRREAVKILIIAHRTELIDQIDESLTRYQVAHNIIAGGRERNYKYPVSVASIQTITNRRNREKAEKLNIQFIIIDEAHHALATSYKKLWKMYPDGKTLGVTATPWRMNHHSFMPQFDRLILSMPIKDFIKQGYLAPYKYFSLKSDNAISKTIDDIELDGFGEYKESSMEEKMDIGSIRAQLLDSYLSLADGKKGIIYAINIAHAQHICAEYQKAGYNAVSIDSNTPAAERKELVNKFKRGLIDIIVNVDIFSEGFDCPDIEFIQLARPTCSLVKYLQQVGRGLRTTENKQECVILDNVGMYSRFGLPDARRHWKYHFIGKDVDEAPKRLTLKGSGYTRFVDTSEGTEDMELIQDVNEEVNISQNVADIDIPLEKTIGKDNYSSIGDFFPVLGVTLGKTTWKQVEDMGYIVEKWKKGPDRTTNIEKVDFWDHEGTGIFTSLYWVHHWQYTDFPQTWKAKGFSWENSFDDWMKAFENMNFHITIISQPTKTKQSGHYMFSARFDATSPNNALTFNLNFLYGKSGFFTSSPGTLYSLTLTYNGLSIDEDVEEDAEDIELCYDNNGVSYQLGKEILVGYPSDTQYESIEIPEHITIIGSEAFKNNKTSEIILHDGIVELQDSIFAWCQNLRTLTMKTETPDDILIDDNAFSDFAVEECVLRVPFEALSRYKGDGRFENFKYITAIEGSRCLRYDENGKEVVGCDDGDCKELVIPEGVTSIAEEAFQDNKDIVNVVFPETLTSIGAAAFSGCSGISKIILNDGLEEIGYDAFRWNALNEVLIPDYVREIGASAFNCEMKLGALNTDFYALDGVLYNYMETKLIIYPSYKKDKHYEVQEGTEEIGYFAFEDSLLKSITLPDSISHISTSVFYSCYNLSKIEIHVEDPFEMEIHKDAFNGFDKKQCKLIIPHGTIYKYSVHPMFKDFMSIEQMKGEDDDDDEEYYEKLSTADIPVGEFKTGQFFPELAEPVLVESKEFCGSYGKYKCQVVMTSKGFFLKILNGGYYFLSDPVTKYTKGSIWIKNQRGTLKTYDASYFSSEFSINKRFGHFTENKDSNFILYMDYKTSNHFTIDLRSGKKWII